MELVPGETLYTFMRREGAAEPRFAARVVVQIAEALDLAHSKGVVHRDLKPSNIMLAGASGAAAQVGLVFNRTGSGARAAGMANAFIAISDDGTAASWNPSGLAQLRKPELSVVAPRWATAWSGPASGPATTWRRSRPPARPIAAPTSTSRAWRSP